MGGGLVLGGLEGPGGVDLERARQRHQLPVVRNARSHGAGDLEGILKELVG